jgi:hypothetical protein
MRKNPVINFKRMVSFMKHPLIRGAGTNFNQAASGSTRGSLVGVLIVFVSPSRLEPGSVV